MEIRYLGFDQEKNARVYQFDAIDKGRATTRHVVTADLTLFRAHHVGIQEGPELCATKLLGDLEKNVEGAHELTADDLRSHATAVVQAQARRAEMRKSPRRVTPSASVEQRSPWRNFGL